LKVEWSERRKVAAFPEAAAEKQITFHAVFIEKISLFTSPLQPTLLLLVSLSIGKFMQCGEMQDLEGTQFFNHVCKRVLSVF
jgi:hypothetical protein